MISLAILADIFPTQAASSAGQVDRLFAFILAITMILSAGIAGVILWFAIRYRRRPGAQPPARITGSAKLELVWIIIPLLLSMVMFFWGARVYFFIAQPPDSGEEVYVVAKQWMWKI